MSPPPISPAPGQEARWNDEWNEWNTFYLAGGFLPQYVRAPHYASGGVAMDYHHQPDPTEQAATMPAEVNAEWAPSNRWDFWFGKANDCYPKSFPSSMRGSAEQAVGDDPPWQRYPKSFPSSMRGSAGQAVGEDPPVPKLNLSAKAPCKGEGSEGAEAQEVRAKAPCKVKGSVGAEAQEVRAKAPCKVKGSVGAEAEAQEVRAKAPKVPKLNLAACSVIQGS